MPIDVSNAEVRSPAWWLKKLGQRMTTRTTGGGESRLERLNRLWSYYEGEPPLPRATKEFADETRELMKMGRANYALLAVEALAERMALLGGSTTADNDDDGDDVIRRLHTGSGMSAVTADVHAYAFGMSEGYVLVGEPDANGVPATTAEDPRWCITSGDPDVPGRVRAALKVFHDEDEGTDVAKLLLPGRVLTARRNGSGNLAHLAFGRGWDWAEDGDEGVPLPVDGGEDVIPLIPFINRFGKGEYEPHLNVLNRINNTICDRLWIAKLQAFRQRALEDESQDDSGELVDAEGKPVDWDDIFKADPGAMWRLPRGAKLWESTPVDLQPILSSIKEDVREFGAVSRTPLSMLAPEASGGSAEGASLHREGLTFKANDRTKRLGPRWAEVYRTQLLFAGELDRARSAITPIWAPTERYSLAQRGSAAGQAKTSGMPWATTMREVWQLDPEQLAQARRERAADVLFQVAGQQPITATGGGAGV